MSQTQCVGCGTWDEYSDLDWDSQLHANVCSTCRTDGTYQDLLDQENNDGEHDEPGYHTNDDPLIDSERDQS